MSKRRTAKKAEWAQFRKIRLDCKRRRKFTWRVSLDLFMLRHGNIDEPWSWPAGFRPPCENCGLDYETNHMAYDSEDDSDLPQKLCYGGLSVYHVL